MNGRPVKIDCQSLRPRYCLFQYTYIDGRLHQLSTTEGSPHKCTPIGELAPLQMLIANVVTWSVDELDQCLITDAVLPVGFSLMSDEALLSVPRLGMASFLINWLFIWSQEVTGTFRTSHRLPLSILNRFCVGTSCSSKKRAMHFLSTVRPRRGTYFHRRYAA